jgi:hypothetical protein
MPVLRRAEETPAASKKEEAAGHYARRPEKARANPTFHEVVFAILSTVPAAGA